MYSVSTHFVPGHGWALRTRRNNAGKNHSIQAQLSAGTNEYKIDHKWLIVVRIVQRGQPRQCISEQRKTDFWQQEWGLE